MLTKHPKRYKKHSSTASKYKYVYKRKNLRYSGDGRWQATLAINNGIETRTKTKGFHTEREAAIWVDKQLLSNGEEPVNILKRKPTS